MKTETAETTPEQDIIQCKNCGRVTAIVAGVNGPECSDCGELICVRWGLGLHGRAWGVRFLLGRGAVRLVFAGFAAGSFVSCAVGVKETYQGIKKLDMGVQETYQGGAQETCHHNISSNNKENIDIPTPAEKREDERFLIFYQNYPRKVGKKKARERFKKVVS